MLAQLTKDIEKLLKSGKAAEAKSVVDRVEREGLSKREIGLLCILNAEIGIQLGDYRTAQADEAIATFRRDPDHGLYARSKLVKGLLLLASGAFGESKQELLEAYGAYLRIEDTWSAGRALNKIALCNYMLGHRQTAIENQFKSAEVFLSLGDHRAAAITLMNAASMLTFFGDLREAQSCFQRLDPSSLSGDVRNKLVLLEANSLLHALRGSRSKALTMLRQGESLLGEHARETALYYEYLGLICILDQDYKGAERALNTGLEISLKIAPESALVSQIKRLFADLYVATEDWKKAERFASEGLAVAEKIQERVEIAACHRALAQIEQHKGREDKARASYIGALEMFAQISTRYELAVCRYRAGASGLFPAHEATAMLFMARQYFSSEEMVHLVKAIDKALAGPKPEPAFVPPSGAPRSSPPTCA